MSTIWPHTFNSIDALFCVFPSIFLTLLSSFSLSLPHCFPVNISSINFAVPAPVLCDLPFSIFHPVFSILYLLYHLFHSTSYSPTLPPSSFPHKCFFNYVLAPAILHPSFCDSPLLLCALSVFLPFLHPCFSLFMSLCSLIICSVLASAFCVLLPTLFVHPSVPL